MNSPLVSIVMAAYNEDRYIGEAIDSILAQTYPVFELIIINDGSTDNTENIILSYRDQRIRYVKNERNIKLIDSLNKGLHMAQGKYIARMDADDICMADRLEKQVSFMEANPDIGLSGSQLQIFGKTEGVMSYPLKHEDIKLRLLITSCFGNNVVIFRRELMQNFNLFYPTGYLHAEDYKCWTEWITRTKTANLGECLVKYRSHGGSVSVQNSSLQKETRNRIRQEYLSKLFHLEKHAEIAAGFTGQLSRNRIYAAKHILKLNEAAKQFDPSRLKAVIIELWYLDALESVEKSFSAFLNYPLIFKLAFGGQARSWINVLKHYLKSKLAAR